MSRYSFLDEVDGGRYSALDAVDAEQGRSRGGGDYSILDEVDSDETDRSVGEIGADLGISFGQGSNSLLKLVGDLYGLTSGDMENWASEQGRRGIQYYTERKSDGLKNLERQRSQKIAAADGVFDKGMTALSETVFSPSLLSSFVAEQLPMLLGSGLGGQVTKGGALALKLSASTATKAGTAGAVATGSAMAGADAGGNAYEEIIKIPDEIWNKNEEYLALAEEIGVEEAKKEIALDMAQDDAVVAAVSSGVLNYIIPGARNLEKLMGGQALPKGRVVNSVTGLLGESAQEAIEEGMNPFLTNQDLQQLGVERDLLEGVGEAAGMGAVGGIFGGLAGAAGPVEVAEDALKKVTEADSIEESLSILNEESSKPVQRRPVEEEVVDKPANMDEIFANDGFELESRETPFNEEALWASQLSPGSESRMDLTPQEQDLLKKEEESSTYIAGDNESLYNVLSQVELEETITREETAEDTGDVYEIDEVNTRPADQVIKEMDQEISNIERLAECLKQ